MKNLRAVTEDYHVPTLEPEDASARQENRGAEQDKAFSHHMKLSKTYNYEPDHVKTIHDYTYRSNELNSYHWDKHAGKDLSKHDPPKEEARTEKMDSLMKVHKTPEDMHVFSKTIHDPRVLKDKDSMVHHPAYMSTSLSRGIAKNLKWSFKKDEAGDTHHHILKIAVPKGSEGAYVDKHSAIPSQREFILPRGSNMKYHDTKTQKLGKDHYHYHEMSLT